MDHEEDLSSITLPDFAKFSIKQYYDYNDLVVDYEDLNSLNAAIREARIALFTVTDLINKAERKEKAAKLNYDREYNREYVKSVEKTETQKRARASIACEELENEYVKYDQAKTDFVRMSNALRLELQTLQALGNNLRQQLKATE